MDIQKKIRVAILDFGKKGQNTLFSAVSQTNGQLLIHKRYRVGSKYVGFLTLFGTRVRSFSSEMPRVNIVCHDI